MTLDLDKLLAEAEANIGVKDIQLAPDVVLSLFERLASAEARAERAEADHRHTLHVMEGMQVEIDTEKAEIARLREAMPSAEEREVLALAVGVLDKRGFPDDARILAAFVRRLPAPVAAKGGE